MFLKILKYESDVLHDIELATQGFSAHVPYADIRRRQSSYIAAEYLPKKKIVIQDPRNMGRDDVKAFLCNVAARQLTMPAKQVFRFKRVATGRKGNGKLQEPVYPGDMDDADAEALREEKQKEKRRRAARKKGKRANQLQPPVTAVQMDGLIAPAVSRHFAGSIFHLTTTWQDTDGAGGNIPEPLQSAGDAPPRNAAHEATVPLAPATVPMPMIITFHSVPADAGTDEPSQDATGGNEEIATSNSTETRTIASLPNPVIDPVLLAMSAQLPTPRHSVTPAPPAMPPAGSRPRPRPKGTAATMGIRPPPTPAQINMPVDENSEMSILPGDFAGTFEPAIDPVVLHVTSMGNNAHSAAEMLMLPPPAGTITGIPSGSDVTNSEQGHAASSTIPAQRKRTMTADELAAMEAKRIGSSSSKRQRRPAAKAK